VVGWYGDGVRPGAAGTALIVGHVDTETRPAVFYKLSTLRPGETIRVIRDDGKVAEFTVDDVRVLTRDHFDAQQAYGTRQSGRAELRLITCGGTFDRTSRSYTANVIVSAYLTGTGRPNPLTPHLARPTTRSPRSRRPGWSSTVRARAAGVTRRPAREVQGPVQRWNAVWTDSQGPGPSGNDSRTDERSGLEG
jgi:hypothetical protein